MMKLAFSWMNVAPAASITGDKDLSMSRDKKGNDVTTPDGEVPYELLPRSCFYCPNLIPVAPLET